MMDGKWKHDDTINLQRYPDYAGTPGLADKIELPDLHGRRRLDSTSRPATSTSPSSVRTTSARLSSTYPDTLQRIRELHAAVPRSARCTTPKFQSKELRQALSLAVDRQAVMNAILVDEKPADDLMPPVDPGLPPGRVHSTARSTSTGAKQKLEESGWSGTMTLNIYARRHNARAGDGGDHEPVEAQPRHRREDQRGPHEHLVRQHARTRRWDGPWSGTAG